MKFEYKAKTLDEVIDIACDEINIDPEYLHYNILSQTDEEVYIEAWTITEVIDYAVDYLLQIIKDYGLEGKATTTLQEGVIRITLDTNHNSILIGKNGKTLQSLNEITRSAVSHYFKQRYKLLLDISDYKDEKYEKIIRIAKRVAREVQNTHIKAVLDPMTSDERRIVHNTLANYHNIETVSTGHGHKRAVNIVWVENKGENVETEETNQEA